MNVLVACEFSGKVRHAFGSKGHLAVSCDLLPTDLPCNGYLANEAHFQGDIKELLHHSGIGWDLIIAHPPCTYLSIAGNAHVNKPGRAELRQEAYDFFMMLYNAPCDKVCIENPVGYMNTHFRKPDQIINPWQFGHHERKRTCLWLRGLPLLQPTNIVEPEQPTYIDYTGKKRYFVDKMSPSPERAKMRSITFQGIANAMAEQWG